MSSWNEGMTTLLVVALLLGAILLFIVARIDRRGPVGTQLPA